MIWRFSRASEERLRTVEKKLQLVARRALVLCPIDFGIPPHGGLRTEIEQHTLFLAGLSKCDGVNTLSPHQKGNALDFFAYVNSEASWDEAHLTTIAASFLQAASEYSVPLEWGGHWRRFRDMPHVQITRDRSRLCASP